MNVFYGKMKSADQCKNLICSSGKNESYFGGMKPGDFVFIRLRNENPPEGGTGSHTHRLWKLNYIEKNAEEEFIAHFDSVFDFSSLKVRDFIRLDLFKLTTNLVVFVNRQSRGKGFFELELENPKKFEEITKSQDKFNEYISNSSHFREVVFLDNTQDAVESDRDIQVCKKQNEFQIFNKNKKFLGDLLDQFKSERYYDFLKIRDKQPNLNRYQYKVFDWLNRESSVEEPSIPRLYDFFCSTVDFKESNEKAEEDETSFDGEDAIEVCDTSSDASLNLILYGPPGTGKTYKSTIKAISLLDEKSETELLTLNYKNEILSKFSNFIKEQRIRFVTFHQSYGYEDFIEGIKPVFKSKELHYEVIDGVFKEFCKKANTDKKNKYCFIIDEINRGNVSKIFGEIITLIEEDKRGDKGFSCVLPYSKELFVIPENVYIIGTMNTADRSLIQLDAALRRRFDFEEVMPDYKLLEKLKVGDIEIDKMLKAMNDRITVLIDREHQIGHSYFLPLKGDPSIKRLGDIFKTKIIPLLQDYFYNDYEAIIKVLNDENCFIVQEDSAYLKDTSFNTKHIFRVISPSKFPTDEDAYKRIYNSKEMTDE